MFTVMADLNSLPGFQAESTYSNGNRISATKVKFLTSESKPQEMYING